MKKYLVNEFQDGEAVYHLSNPHLKMIVINRNEPTTEVTCRWVDKSGISNKQVYLAVELAKFADKKPFEPVTILPGRRNNWG
jgi:hypothetical protein